MDENSSHQPKTDDLVKTGDFKKEELSKKIGNSLKKMYDDVTQEPIPEDFLKILEEADKLID